MRVFEGGCGVGVVECDVGCFVVVVSHGGESCLDWSVVLVVGVVDCVVVGAVEGGEDVFGYYYCWCVCPSVSLHQYFADWSGYVVCRMSFS